MTPKKGRPTPTAPQNRKGRVDLGTGIHQDDTEHRPRAERSSVAELRYRAYRAATRPLRRAFGGVMIDQRLVWRHASGAQDALAEDGRQVRAFVRGQLGGVEDVVKIAQGLGLKRGRVRMILARGLAR